MEFGWILHLGMIVIELVIVCLGALDLFSERVLLYFSFTNRYYCTLGWLLFQENEWFSYLCASSTL